MKLGLCDQLYRPKMESLEEIFSSMRISNWLTSLEEPRLILKLSLRPGCVGAGIKLSSLTAFGSSRLAGMMLPGNGERMYCPLPIPCVVEGSKIVPSGYE